MNYRQAVCKGPSCRRPIKWVLSEKGKRLCLDDAPITRQEAFDEPRGVFFLDEDSGRYLAWAPTIILEVGDLYRTHWGTCPDRDQFRR